MSNKKPTWRCVRIEIVKGTICGTVEALFEDSSANNADFAVTFELSGHLRLLADSMEYEIERMVKERFGEE